MNKKGTSGVNKLALWSIVLVAAMMLVVGGIFAYDRFFGKPKLVTQAALQSPSQRLETSTLVNTGKATSYTVDAKDLEASTPTSLVVAPVYCYETKADGSSPVWIAQGVTTSSSASTPLTFSGVYGVGAKYKCGAFNGTFYGDIVEGVSDTQTPQVHLIVHTAASSLESRGVDSRGGSTVILTGQGNANFTKASATSSGSILSWTLTANQSNRAFKFGALSMDTVASASNVSRFEVVSPEMKVGNSQEIFGGSKRSGQVFTVSYDVSPIKGVSGRASQVDYAATFSSPVLLHFNDYINIPKATVYTETNACAASGQSADNLVIRAHDNQNFQPSDPNKVEILNGYKTDASSPADVGIADLTVYDGYCVANTN